MPRFFRSLIASALFAAGTACTDTLSPEDFYDVWGGDGVMLTLSSTQARFETSCWVGDMAIPIQVDADRFTAIGTVNWQGGAGGSESRAVILIGFLEDEDTMRLTVETSPQMGPYLLRRGVRPTIPGCP